MFRFRRYRVFLAVAVLFTIFVIRLNRSGEWPAYSRIQDLSPPPTTLKHSEILVDKSPAPPSPENPVKVPAKEPGKEAVHASTAVGLKPSPPEIIATSAAPAVPAVETEAPILETVPKVVLPDRTPVPPTRVPDDGTGYGIHAVPPPGRQELPVFPEESIVIHWERQVEHFPVPKESIINLPTGAPLAIPKIQHAFEDETSDAKINRQKRQDAVREEFKRAWNGYKTHAWLHDELSPVSGKFRDPFCGWAATLVDTLDTLWIMGLREDFEEAAKAVDLIDFTTSPRQDIPVFETTIRYLGGLVAAYDVSGASYKNLLDKAVELAEILMGIFDTPNRMPQLYYMWKPTFASQPSLAGMHVGLAELGSLSMEFTRLAQITKDPRYYDAIARITNALSEWQDRGTWLDGVFPDSVDASGCNRTAVGTQSPRSSGREAVIFPANQAEEPIGFQPVGQESPSARTQKEGSEPVSGPGTLEMEVSPGTPGKARIVEWDEKHPGSKKRARRNPDNTQRDPVSMHTNVSTSAPVASPEPPKAKPTIDPITGLPLDIPAAKAKIGNSVGNWDCVEQGLEPATLSRNKFSMGGGQDSTYEYFSKQYLLLGGLEAKYRKMYVKTIDAIRKHFLYRPMTKDGRDILFSGSVTVVQQPERLAIFSADVEHLTCFIGGMVGMGAKVFGIEGDLEIAKKLTDGCVWAYESFPSGIMAEDANVMPCVTVDDCPWNETAYWEFLDPMGPDARESQIKEYYERKAIAEKEADLEATRLAAAELELSDEATSESIEVDIPAVGQDTTDPSGGTNSLRKEKPISLPKRQLEPVQDLAKPVTKIFAEPDPVAKTGFQSDGSVEPVGLSDINMSQEEKLLQQRTQIVEAELDSIATTVGHSSEKPLLPPPIALADPDPWKPLTHQEFVERKIKEENLPPGFSSIRSRKYILRPEAIESVWYMYRITGDTTWQDKGWKMFTSIINATSTEHGHSAIHDVTSKTPYQVDEMESFWLAETLKYFYLLYSPPTTISLDEWVLNTEAHPFKRPV